ncbi:hypothetical protein P3T76_014628 [Phytophthora citrophthora]|uniref:Uncharacterized protein n=1 Tax=Phytophthora citrophthora TaxID=4793 RepID=A0AAD9G1M6_9STRA|nr:hypothetical protein P3T76_014628 [Phytophthora citrophthora]
MTVDLEEGEISDVDSTEFDVDVDDDLVETLAMSNGQEIGVTEAADVVTEEVGANVAVEVAIEGLNSKPVATSEHIGRDVRVGGEENTPSKRTEPILAYRRIRVERIVKMAKREKEKLARQQTMVMLSR